MNMNNGECKMNVDKFRRVLLSKADYSSERRFYENSKDER